MKRKKAFSLLELLAVITILGILVMITITRIAHNSDVAKEKTCLHNRSQINSALERYAVTTGSLPTSLSDIDNDTYFPDGIPTCTYSGAAYTLNATTHRIDGHTNSGNH